MRTDRKIINKRYEDKHKEERKARNGTFSTTMPRKELEEINQFLITHQITKVDLIIAGYEALKKLTTK